MDITEKGKNLSEEELEVQDNVRFKELKDKPVTEYTDDEKKELGELKERHTTRSQKRINDLTYKYRSAEEKTQAAEDRARLAEERIAELESSAPVPKAIIKEDFVEIPDADGNKKRWYTDDTLLAKVNSGDITEAEALNHQRQRNSEYTIAEAMNRIESKKNQEQLTSVRVKDITTVFEKHPEWDNKHQSHNPEDPLFKMTNELYMESYQHIPDGLSKAEKRARQILRQHDIAIDRTDDLSLDSSGSPERKGREQEITLNADEETAAVQMYANRESVLNPKTGKPYTENESKLAALEAKKQRVASRRLV